MQMTNPRTGINLNYHDTGAGAPIILVHGFTGNYTRWAPVAERLARRFRVVDYDLRGHGHSDKGPELDYSFAAHVEDLAGLMDGLGIDRAVIVGHSMGGMIAQYFALRYPERVHRLGLCATTAGITGGRGLKRIAMLVAAFIFQHFFSLGMYFKNRKTTNSLPAELFPERTDPSLEISPMAAAGSLRAMARMDLRDRVGELSAPALIIGSQTDELVDFQLVLELMELVPGAAKLILARSCHFVPLEHPDAVADAVAALADGP